MDSMYAMRRGNGDRFVFDDHGRLRVPVFRSSRDAMSARTRNAGMLLFKPVALDERAVTDIAPANDNSAVYFWLADNASTSVNRGHLIEHTQLARIVRDGGERTPVESEV